MGTPGCQTVRLLVLGSLCSLLMLALPGQAQAQAAPLQEVLCPAAQSGPDCIDPCPSDPIAVGQSCGQASQSVWTDSGLAFTRWVHKRVCVWQFCSNVPTLEVRAKYSLLRNREGFASVCPAGYSSVLGWCVMLSPNNAQPRLGALDKLAVSSNPTVRGLGSVNADKVGVLASYDPLLPSNETSAELCQGNDTEETLWPNSHLYQLHTVQSVNGWQATPSSPNMAFTPQTSHSAVLFQPDPVSILGAMHDGAVSWVEPHSLMTPVDFGLTSHKGIKHLGPCHAPAQGSAWRGVQTGYASILGMLERRLTPWTATEAQR